MRPKFTLRDWLWLVVVIALIVLWRADRQQLHVQLSTVERLMQEQKREFDSAVNRFEEASATVRAATSVGLKAIESQLDRLESQRVPSTVDVPPLPLPEPHRPKPHEQSPGVDRNLFGRATTHAQ